MTRKEALLKLDSINDQIDKHNEIIAKLYDQAEEIKDFLDISNKEEFENLLNLYESSSPFVQTMFVDYIIDNQDNKFNLYL